MSFGLNEISVEDIPQAKKFGSGPTLRSIWIEDLLDQFLDSPSQAAFVEENLDGKKFTAKEATSYASSFTAQTKKKKFQSITAVQRGNRIYLSKIRIRKEK